jgi:hypothetical protein
MNVQSKILNFINKVESEIPVSKWEIDNIKIWPYIRIQMAFDLFLKEDFNEKNQVTKYVKIHKKIIGIFKTTCEAIINYYRDYKKNDQKNNEIDVLYFISSSTRFFKVNKKWYSPYCDTFYPIVKKYGMRQRVLEVASDFQFRIPRYRNSKLIQIRFFFYQFKALIYSKLTDLKLDRFDDLARLESILRENFVTYQKFDVKYFNSRLILFKFYRDYYMKQFVKWKPKVMVCSGYYSLDVLALTSVCNELGIRSIEIQHGVQGNYHIAYRDWSKIPIDGYQLFPNIFWTWGKAEKDNIDSWLKGHKLHEAVVGGNPCLYILDDNMVDLTSSMHTEVQLFLNNNPAEKNIVYTLQSFYDVPEDITSAILSKPNWNWWLRVHPQYSETKKAIVERFKTLQCNNVFVEEAGAYPLKVILHYMDVHITEFSSSVLEAWALGIPSVVISDRAINLFADLIKEGFVKYAESENEIIEYINTFSQKNKLKNTTSIDEFEKAIKKHIIDYINKQND